MAATRAGGRTWLRTTVEPHIVLLLSETMVKWVLPHFTNCGNTLKGSYKMELVYIYLPNGIQGHWPPVEFSSRESLTGCIFIHTDTLRMNINSRKILKLPRVMRIEIMHGLLCINVKNSYCIFPSVLLVDTETVSSHTMQKHYWI